MLKAQYCKCKLMGIKMAQQSNKKKILMLIASNDKAYFLVNLNHVLKFKSLLLKYDFTLKNQLKSK